MFVFYEPFNFYAKIDFLFNIIKFIFKIAYFVQFFDLST